MPPHLHPRSTATSTLFAGTLLASFVVVAIPHLVPCPRPHGRKHLNSEVQFDEQGKPIRRAVRRTVPSKLEQQSEISTATAVAQSDKSLRSEAVMFKQLQQEAEVIKAGSKDRECPVPKPKGALGRWLGFDEARAAELGKD